MQGYELAWSPFLEGTLLSGSDDAQICLWDIAGSKGANKLEAKAIYHEHAGVVEVCSRGASGGVGAAPVSRHRSYPCSRTQ